MPTRGGDNDLTFLQRARNYYWKPGDSGWRNALRVGRAALTGPASLAGAVRSAAVGEAREFITDRFGNRVEVPAVTDEPTTQQRQQEGRAGRVEPTAPPVNAPVRDNGVRGNGAVPGLQERGFGQSFASGQNSFAPLVGAFTGYGQFGTRNAYNEAAAGGPPVALAGTGAMPNTTPASRGPGGGSSGSGGGALSGGGTGTGTGSGEMRRSRWLPSQTGSRLVKRH